MATEDFTRTMKKATREIHALSDALVNAKLTVSLSSNEVWSEGLLVFYEIFKYLEEAIDRHPNTYISDLCIEGMRRTKAFEEDLDFYSVDNWRKTYVPRECVLQYLSHLQHLEEKSPLLLMAYIYHLYMGILTGGHILRKKRELFGSHSSKKGSGYAITEYRGTTLYTVKRELRAKMNSIAEVLDEETKQQLIDESKMVFVLNNTLIRSVRGTYQVLFRKCLFCAGVVALMVSIYYMIQWAAPN